MDDRGLGPLGDILGLALRLAHGAVQRHFNENFAALALTQKQISVLWLAECEPGIGQSEIARRLEMDRATTMAIVHALERRALLRRSPAARDRRRVALHLTGDGARKLAAAKAAIAAHEQWLKARFDPGELAALRQMLARIRR